jgi:lipoprotein-anchoring transpeptidase ErfK/SrfK
MIMVRAALLAFAVVAACSVAIAAAAPARSESVLVGTLKQCHSAFDCKTTDLQLARVTGEGVVKKLGIIYRGIPDAQRLSTTVVAAGSAASGIFMVLVTSPVELNTTAVVLRIAADALSFTVVASKAIPYINATAISFDEPATCACGRPDPILPAVSFQ